MEIRVKLETEHWYEHVPKLVERGDEGEIMKSTSANQENPP
jgi:hypothetical protein